MEISGDLQLRSLGQFVYAHILPRRGQVSDRDEGGPKIRTIVRRRRLRACSVAGLILARPFLDGSFFAGLPFGLPTGAREKQQSQNESHCYRCKCVESSHLVPFSPSRREVALRYATLPRRTRNCSRR